LQLPPEKLIVTVYKNDEDAARIWGQVTGWGKDAERNGKIVRKGSNLYLRCLSFYLFLCSDFCCSLVKIGTGKEDNFWAMGDSGPCGPCTEIFWDHGKPIDGDRVRLSRLFFSPFIGLPVLYCSFSFFLLLLLLLVPSQISRDLEYCVYAIQSGSWRRRSRPQQALGLERMLSVLQGVPTNYDIDINRSIINSIQELVRERTKGAKLLNYVNGLDHSPDSSYSSLFFLKSSFLSSVPRFFLPVVSSWSDTALKVILDHLRASIFLIA
jgi:alanyl-tRNA synthetase